jgi:hypothetical protein
LALLGVVMKTIKEVVLKHCFVSLQQNEKDQYVLIYDSLNNGGMSAPINGYDVASAYFDKMLQSIGEQYENHDACN